MGFLFPKIAERVGTSSKNELYLENIRFLRNPAKYHDLALIEMEVRPLQLRHHPIVVANCAHGHTNAPDIFYNTNPHAHGASIYYCAYNSSPRPSRPSLPLRPYRATLPHAPHAPHAPQKRHFNIDSLPMLRPRATTQTKRQATHCGEDRLHLHWRLCRRK